MRAARIGAIIGILGALVAAPSVSAGPPTATTITIHVVFDDAETFTTTGGLLCDSGTAVSDPFFQTFGGRKNNGIFTFHLVKTLTCDGGSGTFKLLVDASAPRDFGGTIGGFAAGQGTGDMSAYMVAATSSGIFYDGGHQRPVHGSADHRPLAT